ncbi:hypothetical protein [Micromonospora sp. NPDC047730]|uniref:hypothetical protein n=1 Tax=Micromonospora sp. NPDC047730 TaxID=3364253 RepID=UPI003722D0F4
MELILTLNCDGTTVRIPIQPGDEPQAVAHVYFQPMTVELIPDCEETDYDHRGDCDGQTRRRQVIHQGAYGHARGEGVYLCTLHGRQAARRGEVEAL